ncbi:ATP-dependent helicase [Desulfotomaculum varum]
MDDGKASRRQEHPFLAWVKKETGISLNSSQQQAVLHKDGPLLLLATPGAGKTTVLNLRIAYLLLEHQADPRQILALTFSRAAARDMEARFQNLFGRVVRQPVRFSTIHSFAYQVVANYFRHRQRPFKVIENETGANSKSAVLKSICQRFYGAVVTEENLEELANAIGYVKNAMLPLADIDKLDFKINHFKEIYLAYEQYKKTGYAPTVLLDFDDMLTLAHDILEKEPGLLAFYQNQYRYIMTDESQDTSLIQHKIIEKIARPHGNLFMVGDEDQAIYGFRGAAPQYLLEFKQTYPGAKVIAMAENFRSSQEIVNLTNRFIKANQKRYAKEMFTRNGSHQPVHICKFKHEGEQWEYLVRQLAGTGDLSQVAIIYRNNASAIGLINKLEQQGIPFYLRDFKNRFFAHWVVEDVLNFLRFSYNDKSTAVLERIHTKLYPFISKDDLAFLIGLGEAGACLTVLADRYAGDSKKARGFLKLHKYFNQLNKLSPQWAIRFIRQEMKYEESAERICNSLGYSFDNVKSILATLEHIAGGLPGHQEFACRLKKLEKIMAEAKNNQGRNAVTLTTMHSAKGLEFQRVYLIDLVEGVIPGAESIKRGNQDSLEEERRLFYVGMTRAGQELFLLTVENYQQEQVQESRFVKEVRQILQPADQAAAAQAQPVPKPPAAGMFIDHKKFGVGKVLSVNVAKDTLRVGFESGQVKDLLYSACVENNLIRIL